MHIDKIEPAGGTRFVTVTMSADEANDIANGLYEATRVTEVREEDIFQTPVGEQYNPIYAKWGVVRDMVRDGVIDPLTIRRLYDLQRQQEELQKQRMQKKLQDSHV